MKKLVFKLDLHDDKEKQKVMMAVSGLSGVNSISMDMKERKLTVIGDIDPVTVVSKLRKNWPTDIVFVGLAKKPEKKKEDGKKPEKKKEDGKKDDGKKEDGKKGDGKKKEDGKKGDGKKKEDGKKDDGKKKDPNEQYREFMKTYGPRAPANMPYYVYSDEENPNTCVIA